MPPALTLRSFLDEAQGMPSFWVLAGGLGVVCCAAALGLEIVFPWREELPARLGEALAGEACSPQFDPIACPAWPPALAGVLLGLLQLGHRSHGEMGWEFLGSFDHTDNCAVGFGPKEQPDRVMRGMGGILNDLNPS